MQSLVVACGIRKVWSKVFEGIDRPSQQIKKLKEILSDLGMKGRYSLEQAKAIKEKRELAQELGNPDSYLHAISAKISCRGCADVREGRRWEETSQPPE